MKNVGIWIDRTNAKIVSLEAGKERLDTLMSNVESFNVTGGSGTRLKGGPQDVVQDSKYLEREKHQLAQYFEAIMEHIADAEAIVVFGPAQTGESLRKRILENDSRFHSKEVSLEKADSMTDNQIMAWVRSYYASDN